MVLPTTGQLTPMRMHMIVPIVHQDWYQSYAVDRVLRATTAQQDRPLRLLNRVVAWRSTAHWDRQHRSRLPQGHTLRQRLHHQPCALEAPCARLDGSVCLASARCVQQACLDLQLVRARGA